MGVTRADFLEALCDRTSGLGVWIFLLGVAVVCILYFVAFAAVLAWLG